ncbi:phosphoribosylformylglycinamidine synthase subunit PurS [Tenuibacillus multivorans]|uniref:Phosphoribosylformylglycinamidine synthase subunit PurS n=1 Tax=Tenuibacillus multivorans TaxID=237069 RepID=A0A1H0F8K4_9BACI|nr:phosphoribosylformylglycinamidine synthase subunit PurS [Tenuibacillus multivorans]GEL78031.1 phosphoribosylformylglycinamidine synthase subunit PurS [Tenuibacillus multivorans]SDN90925.1 phosphoribosylformylglycinamidine synthase [Tenuibacillus multivorans]
MVKVKVYVTLKEGVLDPQGKAVEQALLAKDFKGVSDMRIGKYMEFYMDRDDHSDRNIQSMCKQLLANPVIEDYRYETEEVVHQ